MERRMKKAQASNKKNLVFKREFKDKEKELKQVRRELIDTRHTNSNLMSSNQELKDQLQAE